MKTHTVFNVKNTYVHTNIHTCMHTYIHATAARQKRVAVCNTPPLPPPSRARTYNQLTDNANDVFGFL